MTGPLKRSRSDSIDSLNEMQVDTAITQKRTKQDEESSSWWPSAFVPSFFKAKTAPQGNPSKFEMLKQADKLADMVMQSPEAQQSGISKASILMKIAGAMMGTSPIYSDEELNNIRF